VLAGCVHALLVAAGGTRGLERDQQAALLQHLAPLLVALPGPSAAASFPANAPATARTHTAPETATAGAAGVHSNAEARADRRQHLAQGVRAAAHSNLAVEEVGNPSLHLLLCFAARFSCLATVICDSAAMEWC
jgi:hypothetical protein